MAINRTPENQHETLTFIAAQTKELKKLAQNGGFELLEYLLAMAQLEAEEQSSSSVKRDGVEV